MNVTTHASFDAMLDEIAASRDLANAGLADEQRALTWGSHFVNFDHVADGIVIFGRARTEEEITTALRACVETDEEFEEIMASERENLANGYLTSICGSIACVETELGDTHRGSAWPITAEQYAEAEAAGWDLAAMSDAIDGWLGQIWIVALNHERRRAG